eukprot:XP_015143423.2 inverted formin-2-like [Gallus gallus]
MAEQQGQKSNQGSNMEPGDSMKNLLTSRQCLNHRKSLPRRSVEKLCSNPGCSHFTCGYSEQPCPKKTPKLRMKVFHWQKLPSDVVRQSRSMWAVVPSGSKELVEPDYASLELLFCASPTKPKETRPTKKSKEVTFISPKKSLLLSIFLKQFKCCEALLRAVSGRGFSKLSPIVTDEAALQPGAELS